MSNLKLGGLGTLAAGQVTSDVIPFGELSGADDIDPVVITLVDDVEILVDLTAGGSRNAVLDAPNGTITVKASGNYQVICSCSFTTDKAAIVHGSIYVNAVEKIKVKFKRNIAAGAVNLYGAAPATGLLLALAIDDVIDFRLTSNAAATTITVEHFNMVIGGKDAIVAAAVDHANLLNILGTGEYHGSSAEMAMVTALLAAGSYEVGTWTPALDFVTTGDLALTAVTVNGRYIRIGALVILFWDARATMTFTTSSGNLIITGIPYSLGGLLSGVSGPTTRFNAVAMSLEWATLFGASAASIGLRKHGSIATSAAITAVDVASGAVVRIDGTLIYEVA